MPSSRPSPSSPPEFVDDGTTATHLSIPPPVRGGVAEPIGLCVAAPAGALWYPAVPAGTGRTSRQI